MKKSVLWICSTLLLCCIASRNQITNLPGLENMPSFQQFAGYININDTDAQKGYYYWFVESQTNPENAPILLWLQGGRIIVTFFFFYFLFITFSFDISSEKVLDAVGF